MIPNCPKIFPRTTVCPQVLPVFIPLLFKRAERKETPGGFYFQATESSKRAEDVVIIGHILDSFHVSASPSLCLPTPWERTGGASHSHNSTETGPGGSGLVSDSWQRPLPAEEQPGRRLRETMPSSRASEELSGAVPHAAPPPPPPRPRVF